jgi:hypothetical protein
VIELTPNIAQEPGHPSSTRRRLLQACVTGTFDAGALPDANSIAVKKLYGSKAALG